MIELALSFALAVRLVPQDSPAPVERSGPHFLVVCHFGSAPAAEEALQAAEAAWPLALEALDLKEAKLEAPLTIHVYPDAASYEQAEEKLTQGRFKANLAFSHQATKSSHVALQPPCSPEVLRDFGLPTLTRYLIAHEASHLVAYAFLPNAANHPEWFTEGVGTYVGNQALLALGRTRPLDEEPFSAKGAVRCQELVAKNQIPRAGAILGSQIGQMDFHPRYSLCQLFYEFLRKEEGKELKKAVAAIKKLGGGDDYLDRLQSDLGKIWKEKSLEKLDARFLEFVRARQPQWNESLRSLETRGEDYVQRAFAGSNAVALRAAPLAALPITASGTLRILPGAAHQMNFLLGRTEQGFLSIAFTAGHGVSLFRCDYGAEDKWTLLGEGELKSLPIGTDAPFRIEAGAEELVVFVEDQEVLRAKLGGRSPLGQWGLGAQAGSTGVWKALVVKAAPG